MIHPEPPQSISLYHVIPDICAVNCLPKLVHCKLNLAEADHVTCLWLADDCEIYHTGKATGCSPHTSHGVQTC